MFKKSWIVFHKNTEVSDHEKHVLMKKKMDRMFNTKLPVLSNKQIYKYKEKRGPWKWTWIKLKNVNYIDDKKTYSDLVLILMWQSPQQAVTGSPGYIYATTMHSPPELMYAQAPPHGYPTEHGEPGLMSDGQQAVEVIAPYM